MSGFWSWLFSFYDRHYRDASRYSKNVWGRVSALVTELVFIGIGLGLVYWATILWNDKNIIVAILITLLTIGVLFSAVEYCLVYAFFGFKCAITGSLEGFLAKASDKKKKKHAKAQVVKTAEQTSTMDEALVQNNGLENMVYSDSSENDAKTTELEERRHAKKLKWLDLCVGIFSIAFAVGALLVAELILGGSI